MKLTEQQAIDLAIDIWPGPRLEDVPDWNDDRPVNRQGDGSWVKVWVYLPDPIEKARA